MSGATFNITVDAKAKRQSLQPPTMDQCEQLWQALNELANMLGFDPPPGGNGTIFSDSVAGMMNTVLTNNSNYPSM